MNILLGYIDPGTGSYIIQVLIAGLLGFLFVIRNFLRTWGGKFLAMMKSVGRK